ncbi:MAG: hypothetical protein HC913_05675 [Microscillaceae bacterium]|nr:hypothetical protein [Microscillaceae bacterium]
MLEADFIYGKVVFKKSKYVFGQELDMNSIAKQNICHQAIFVKRKLFDLLGKFNTCYTAYADYDFNLRCFGNKQVQKVFIDYTVALYYEEGFSKQHGDLVLHVININYY